jgi:hypothetical protein
VKLVWMHSVMEFGVSVIGVLDMELHSWAMVDSMERLLQIVGMGDCLPKRIDILRNQKNKRDQPQRIFLRLNSVSIRI